MVKTTDKFNFFIPAEFSKGGKNGEMKIKGIASSETEDSDGETLVPGGYDLAPLLKTGFLNYNHKGAENPSAIIGEPTKAEIINNGKDLYIEGFLYANSKKAIETYELARTLEENSPTRRMGFSIEGKALEKDPFNPKRITKARITGVAITPCPKNPNTLLSIMKGDYDTLWVDDEENEEDVDKAMTAAAGEGVTQVENVDGGEKILDKLLKEKTLSKSEVYASIFNKYENYLGTELTKAKDIFSLVQEINNKSFDMKNGEILEKAIQNAFNFIDQQIDLVKGEDKADKETEEEEEGLEETDKKEEGKDKVEKAEYSGDLGITTPAPIPAKTYGGVEVYLKNIIGSQLKKGDSPEQVTSELVEKGMSEEDAKELVKSCLEEMNALEENGGVDPNGLKTEVTKPQESTHSSKSPGNPFAKSLEDSLDLIKGEFQESLGTIEGKQVALIKGIEQRFQALGTILKSHASELGELQAGNQTLLESNQELRKSLEEAQLKLQEYGKQPARPMRSVTASTQVERFSNDIAKSETAGGKNTYSMSNPSDIYALSKKLEGEFDSQISKGNNDKALGDAILDLTINKSLSSDTAMKIGRTLKELDIQIVQ